jgi:hypothetical protein
MIKTYKKSITLSLLTLGLTLFPLIADAGYSPPPQQERAGDHSKSMGVRTGSNLTEEDYPLTIIAPQVYVGQTASVTPSFVWIVGNQNTDYEVDFRLFEFNEQGKIKQRGETLRFQQKGGIHNFSFPSNQTPLAVGKKYLWQVAIRQSPDVWMIQRAEFRVVEMPIFLSQQVANSLQKTEQAERYAENGLWYDALMTSLSSTHQGELNPQVSNFIKSLVESEHLEPSEGVDAKIITRRNNTLIKLAEYYK